MDNQVFYEDVVEGQELPPFEKRVTTVNILMYLSTVWLMDRIHFDHPFATHAADFPMWSHPEIWLWIITPSF
jgi:hypothetical protein